MPDPKANAIGPVFTDEDDDGLPVQQRAVGASDEELTPVTSTAKKPARRALRRERSDDDPLSPRAGKRDDGDPRREPEEQTGDLMTPMSFDILPTPPEIPGWHLIWLSSTNIQDSIQNRQRIGYQMVKADEIGADYAAAKVTDGNFMGGVMVREMVLHKIPQDRYEALMMHAHHNEPLESEVSIKQDLGSMEEQLATHGSNVMVGSAVRELGRRPIKPQFE